MEDLEDVGDYDESSIEEDPPRFQMIGASGVGQIADDDPSAVAERISAIVARINSDYLRLGREVYLVLHRRLFLKWGYSSFEECMSSKFGISRERAEQVRRVWAKFVKELRIPYESLDGIGFGKARLLLPIVNDSNVRGLIDKARAAPTIRELRDEVDLIRGKRKAVVQAKETSPQVAETEIRPAGPEEASRDPGPPGRSVIVVPPERPTKVTFNLYPNQREIIDAAIRYVQTEKRSDIEMAPNEALAHVATGFLADRLTRDQRPNAQLRFYLYWFERVFGGKFIWITSEEAIQVLSKAIHEHPDLFPDQGKTDAVNTGPQGACNDEELTDDDTSHA